VAAASLEAFFARFEDWRIGETARDVVQQGAGSRGQRAGLFRKEI
jgi:hypothetical protein